MFFIGTFFKRIANDFTHKELLPLKLLFFVHSSTLYVLYPYLTIHMRALGINVEETAIMSAVTPLVAIVMPPIAGLIADRIGNFKVILSILSGISGAAALLLLMVPVGRETIHFPKTSQLQLYNSQGKIGLEIGDPYPCNTINHVKDVMSLNSCGMSCSLPSIVAYGEGGEVQDEKYEDITNTKEFQLQLGPNNETYHYTLDGGISGVTRVNSSSFFFPMPDLFGFSCRVLNKSSAICSITRVDSRIDLNGTSPSKPTDYSVKLNVDNRFYELASVKLKAPGFTDDFRNLTAISYDEDENEDHTLSVSVDGETIELQSCRVTCLASARRAKVCSNLVTVKEYDISLTFWLYLTVRVFIGMISGTLFPMFEGAVIAILREQKADYGLQRIYATIGGMISSPLSGWLIDYASEKAGYTDFRPAFYLYAALKIVSALLMLTINLEFKAPATDVVSDVIIVLKKIEIVALLATCFILGTAWGYIESFLFWLLQDLGASRSLMGITITVGGIAGLPLLVMSGPIIDKIGHANVLFIGFIFYAIRLMGYSLIYNPWMCLIFEAMESVTSSLAFTAAVTYAAKLSTTATDASIQGLVGGLYYGVGKGAGSLFGGYLMKMVGTRPTYQIFSAVTLATGIIYYLFNRLYIVKKTQQDSKSDSIEKGVPNGELKDKSKEKSSDVMDENIPMTRNSNHTSSYRSHDTERRNSSKEGNGNINKGYTSDEVDNQSKRDEKI